MLHMEALPSGLLQRGQCLPMDVSKLRVKSSRQDAGGGWGLQFLSLVPFEGADPLCGGLRESWLLSPTRNLAAEP